MADHELWHVILPFCQLAAEAGLYKHKVIVRLEKGKQATLELYRFLDRKRISLVGVEDLPSDVPISALTLDWGPDRLEHDFPKRVQLLEESSAEADVSKDAPSQNVSPNIVREVQPVRSQGFRNTPVAAVDTSVPKTEVNPLNVAAPFDTTASAPVSVSAPTVPVVHRKAYIVEAAEEGLRHGWQDAEEEQLEPGQFVYDVHQPQRLLPRATAENFLRANRASAGFVRLLDASRQTPFAEVFPSYVQTVLERAGFDGEQHSLLLLSPLTLSRVSLMASELHNSSAEYLGAGYSPVYEAYSTVSGDPFEPANVTALVVYFGYSEAQVVPVYFGGAGEASLRVSSALGSRTLAQTHRSTLQSRGETVPDENRLFAQVLQLGEVAQKGQRALSTGEKLAEMLFEGGGVLKLIEESINSAPEEKQAELLANVIVGGALKRWPGLVRRLRAEISELYPHAQVGVKRSLGAFQGAQRMTAVDNFTGIYCLDRDGMFQGRSIALHAL